MHPLLLMEHCKTRVHMDTVDLHDSQLHVLQDIVSCTRHVAVSNNINGYHCVLLQVNESVKYIYTLIIKVAACSV